MDQLTDNQHEQSHVQWRRQLAPYVGSDNRRAIGELFVTLVPFIALYAFMAWAISAGNWFALLLALPTAAMLVRLFAIQHDCGHGSFFTSKHANDWLGRILGVLTFTPYDDWRREHALHHTHSGNLSRRGFGDIMTLTTAEYRARGFWGRFSYRLYRNPLVLFVLGPAWQFFLRHRWPTGKTGNIMPMLSVHATNIGILITSVLMIWLVGWKIFLAIQIPVTLIGAAVGVWLFYIQHQFEGTYWEHDSNGSGNTLPCTAAHFMICPSH